METIYQGFSFLIKISKFLIVALKKVAAVNINSKITQTTLNIDEYIKNREKIY